MGVGRGWGGGKGKSQCIREADEVASGVRRPLVAISVFRPSPICLTAQ